MSTEENIRFLVDKATQGDWWIDSHGHSVTNMETLKMIFKTDNDSMGPATRHPETGNLSHWPNDWDASYIVAVQPKNVKALLDEIDELRKKASLYDHLCAMIDQQAECVAVLVEALDRIANLPMNACSTENDYRLSTAKAIALAAVRDFRKGGDV